MARTLSVSEARRLLPRLIDEIARDGGRIDITRRGEPLVSIVRSADLEPRTTDAQGAAELPSALQVAFTGDPGALDEEIRELRRRTGQLRSTPGEQAERPRRSSKKPRR